VSVNTGFEPEALARVASGGELSRIMLALKSILAHEDRIPSLVFDEIDAGIGGRVPAVREAVRSVDPTVLIEDMSPLPAILAENTVETRHYAILLGVFSLIALAIAAVGVYATVSYAVTRRLREMGIRRAVGARGSDVATLVLRRAMLQAAAGAAIGLSLALAAARSLESLLFEITPADPATYAIVVAVLLAAALAACAAPAIRATRADPLAILRTD
jgi:putative ABC transport system permease protein